MQEGNPELGEPESFVMGDKQAFCGGKWFIFDIVTVQTSLKRQLRTQDSRSSCFKVCRSREACEPCFPAKSPDWCCRERLVMWGW